MLMNPFLQNGLFFFLAFVFVGVLVPFAIKISLRTGFVDKPGGRKRHDGGVPPVGGLVIFPVFMILAGFYGLDWEHYAAFYTALALLLIVGGLDDRFNVRPLVRFGAHFVAAFLIVIGGGAKLSQLGDVFGFGTFWLGFMAVPFSVIAVVLLINAINLMDGLDGLAGGKGFVALFWLAVCGSGQGGVSGVIFILMGALAGFLFYNMRHPFRERATVFLGDAGSLTLGLSLAWFSISLGRGSSPDVAPMTVAWILALPIFDICGQFARRVSEGRHPFDADHDHFHHHFINTGLSVAQSTSVVVFIGFVMGGIGVAGHIGNAPDYVMAYTWIALLLGHIFMSLKPERFRAVISCLMAGKSKQDS